MFAKLHQKMRLGGKRFVIAGRGAGADFIASCPKTSKHGVASKPIGIALSQNSGRIMGSTSTGRERRRRWMEEANGLKTQRSERNWRRISAA